MAPVKYTDEDLIEILKTFYSNNGRVPMIKDFQKIKPNESTFTKRFGSWSNALKKAGLNKNKYTEDSYTKEELIDSLKRFYKEFGKVPTAIDLKTTDGYPSPSPFVRVFGNYKTALIEASLFEFRNDKNLFERTNYTEDELKILLKQLINELGRVPVYEDINKSIYMPHSSTYIRFFGSLSDALSSIEFDIEKQKEIDNKVIEEDMLNKYKELSLMLDRTPTVHDIINYSKQGKCYSLTAYNNHFGDTGNINQLLNLTPYKIERTRDDLVADLINLSTKLNRTIIQEDISLSQDMACVNKYISEFGSWENVLKLVGMKMSKSIFYSSNNIKCFSIFELKFTNMLEFYNYKFDKEVPYSNLLKTEKHFRFDFVVELNNKKYPIEIFGYVNNKKYDEKTKIKKILCQSNTINLIDLYPIDFKTSSLEEIKNNFLKRIK